MNIRHAYVLPNVVGEREMVLYAVRFCPKDATTIHLHAYKPYRKLAVGHVTCSGQGCYTVLPVRTP